MRIALFSDVHANLPALEAVLGDIDEQWVDYVFCLGDLVNFAGWDNEVIEEIRKRHIVCLQGNHDFGIGQGKKEFDFSYVNEEERRFTLNSIEYVNRRILPENRKFLSELPTKLIFNFPFCDMKMVLLHFCRQLNRNYMEMHMTDAVLLDIMKKSDADILVMGHLHGCCHRVFSCGESGSRYFRHLIQVGAVGKSKPDYMKANYCLLDIGAPVDRFSFPDIRVDFRYVPYDARRVVEKIHSIGLSHAFDHYYKL